MKYKWFCIFIFLMASCVVSSTPIHATCTNANCSASIVCPSGFEKDREGCKTCRCTPNPKNIKTWTFNATVVCPVGQILSKKVRFFSASWIEGQNSVNDFYWDYQPYSYDLSRKITLTNYTPSDTMYFGLESDARVIKSLYWGGTSEEYQELTPTGSPPSSSISYGKWFNPYTSMASFRTDILKQGTYNNIQFSIPDAYKSLWCVPRCYPVFRLCTDKTCGQPAKCIKDGCGGSSCCPATAPCPPPVSSCSKDCPADYTCVNVKCPAGAECFIGGPTCLKNTPPVQPPPSTSCGSNQPCPNGQECYQPPMPACPPGEMCAQVMPPKICVTPTNSCSMRPQGDANCDGTVDRTDFTIFAGFVRGQGYINSTYSADFNTDGKVNLEDYEIWRNTFYK